MSVGLSDEGFVELVREEIRAAVQMQRPLIVDEIAKSCELLDEESAIAMLPIRGKDPRRTFRRLMTEHGVAYVSMGSFRWWKRSVLQELIDQHSVESPKRCRLQRWLKEAA